MKTKSVVASLATIFFIFAISLTVSALAQPADLPTADRLEVEDASGKSGTEVEVPVNIKNVTNGPVQSIGLIVDYNEYVLNLTSFESGDLTSEWTRKILGEDRHTLTIATLNNKVAIPNGSSGSVVLLKFHVIGSSGDTSPMDLSRVELSDQEGWKVGIGTVPVSKGTFTVKSSNGGGSSSGDGGSGGSTATPTPTPTPVPTSTPTEKPPAVSEENEEEKLTEPYSPTLASTSVTPSLATPVQTNASTAPELTAKANPIWVIVLIAVLIIAVIIYVVFNLTLSD